MFKRLGSLLLIMSQAGIVFAGEMLRNIRDVRLIKKRTENHHGTSIIISKSRMFSKVSLAPFSASLLE